MACQVACLLLIALAFYGSENLPRILTTIYCARLSAKQTLIDSGTVGKIVKTQAEMKNKTTYWRKKPSLILARHVIREKKNPLELNLLKTTRKLHVLKTITSLFSKNLSDRFCFHIWLRNMQNKYLFSSQKAIHPNLSFTLLRIILSWK